MQENEFEKKVEDRLSDLKLPPSDAVWATVEVALQKKKRRRVIFFISLLAGLALAGYTSYTLLDREATSSLAHEKNTPLNNENNTPGTNEDKINEPEDDYTNRSSRRTNEVKRDNGGETNAITPLKEEVKQSDRNLFDKPVTTKKEEIAINNKTNPKVYSKKEKTVNPVTIDQKEISDVKRKNNKEKKKVVEDVAKPDQQKDIVQQVDPIQPAIEKTGGQSKASDKIINDDSKKEDTATVADTMKAHAMADTAAADIAKEQTAQPKKIAAKKIKWGLDLSVGRTFSRNEAFSVVNSGRTFTDRSYFNNSPITSGAPQTPGGVEPPSSVSAGPAFKAGVFAEMNLSKRSSVVAGLRYAYLSEKMKVGNYKDTFFVSNSYFSNASNNGFYGPTRQKEHTNSYHFIELPVSYQLRLNKPGKVQVLWNAGITAAYLVNTSSLVYDTTAGGIYYKQPNVTNRLHFNLNTGFSLRFITKKNFAWSVGPELSLDMTRVMKQDVFTRERYLFYGGLSAKIFLPSLKK